MIMVRNEVDAEGRTAHEILHNEILDHSSWHFFQSRSWLDYAKRERRPSAIHYAAFELRYGVEYLLFQLLVLTNESLTQEQYQKCLGDPTKMKKMLSSSDTNYHRLIEFTKICASLDSKIPNLVYWDINRLFKFWGIASEYLHFVGIQALTYREPDWLARAIDRLTEALDAIWKEVTENIGIGLLRPSAMQPEVFSLWKKFSNGELSDVELLSQLKKLQPDLKHRAAVSAMQTFSRPA